jgi:hypothetical protein
VTNDEAKRIRDAEAKGGRQAGLLVVLELLREKTRAR